MRRTVNTFHATTAHVVVFHDEIRVFTVLLTYLALLGS